MWRSGEGWGLTMYEILMSMSCVFYVLMDFMRTELLTELYETTPTESPHYGKLNSSPVFTILHTYRVVSKLGSIFLFLSKLRICQEKSQNTEIAAFHIAVGVFSLFIIMQQRKKKKEKKKRRKKNAIP